MKCKRLFLAWLLSLMLLGTFSAFLPQTPMNIPLVYAATLPTDGDAWTENDNATYPWTVSTTYTDDIQFVTSEKQVGSYSLRVNHTSATIRMRFFLDIGSSQNVSSYWGLRFWIRFERADLKKIRVALASHIPYETGGNYFEVVTRPSLNAWTEVIIPLTLFKQVGSGANEVWTAIRYMGFYVSENVGAGDGSKVFVDGLRFIEAPTTTITNSRDDTTLANLYSALTRSEKTVVYNSNSYTSLYDWMNLDGTDDEGNLESEALGQSIFALSWIYELTSADVFLDKANVYANWLINFQNSSYGYMYYSYNNVTEQFSGSPTVSVSGWVLAGLSYLYGVTSNTTYQNAADSTRSWICDYMYVDETGWYPFWNNTSGSGYGTTTVESMVGGGANVGLGYYYHYVSQNSTVKSQIDATYSYKLGTLQSGDNNILDWGTFEQSAYNFNGLYINAEGTMNNSTFWNTTVRYMTHELEQYILVYGNGSMTNQKYNGDISGWDILANWGLAVELPILYKVYEEYDSNALVFLQKVWYDWVDALKGSYWFIPFVSSGADSSHSWTPTQIFVYASLIEYYWDTITTPYVITTNEEVISSSFASEQLTFTVSASSGETSTTRIYVGSRGEPSSVTGATSSSYDSGTNILTVTVSHASEQQVEIEWTIPSTLITLVRNNYYTVLTLLGLLPIILGSVIVVGVIKGKQTLTAKEVGAIIALFVTIVVTFIIIWNVMNAIIGG